MVLALALLAVPLSATAVQEWLPITPEELQLQGDPKAPGAPAVYLYRQVDRDDNSSWEDVYVRIKILTEEGHKYADVEIPFEKYREKIRYISARTIQPDGGIVEFKEEIYEKSIVESRERKYLAKTFTLPNVRVGSIVEYRFRRLSDSGYVFDSRWVLSDELFTRHAKFSLRPSDVFPLRWSWPIGLPPGTPDPAKVNGLIRLETRDVPAFVTEQYMPPQDTVKYRVDFIYDDERLQNDPAKFWSALGKRRFASVRGFIGTRWAQKAVADIVQPTDPADVKLEKIYARVMQLRNLTYEPDRTEQEEKREKLTAADSAEEVWKRGYGYRGEITWVFLGLVKAAGLEAYPVLVPTRDRTFFDQRLMNPNALNSSIVVARLDGKDLYFDPGTPCTPFGMLTWSKTGVNVLRLEEKGATWINTPTPPAYASRVDRHVRLKLTPQGSLEGRVTVTYTGLEALWRRVSQLNEDEHTKQEFLEDEVKRDMTTGIHVRLINSPDWNSSSTSMTAEYDLEVPGWASSAGNRRLLPLGLFAANEKRTFQHATRVHPVYFSFPYQYRDDITITLPDTWQVSSAPKPRVTDMKAAYYSMESQARGNTLQVSRRLTLNLIIVESSSYGTLRKFFENVRAGDEDQAVVTPQAGTPAQAQR